MPAIRYLLLPFAWIYGAVLWVRHRLFDIGWMHSAKAPVKTVVLGNLALGGTGKTPHAEYILKLLGSHKVGFLSRGYGRKTRGFQWVDPEGDPLDYGDEPFQVARKFRNIPVAVCEDRLAGIRAMKEHFPDLEWVVLDDAFQHRRLRGDINIVLTTWQHPFWKDKLVPAGGLRDIASAVFRADAIVVSKCPVALASEEMERLKNAIPSRFTGKIFFSGLQYGEAVSPGSASAVASQSPVIGFCGIAQPQLFESCLAEKFDLKKFKSFGDHHEYTPGELSDLRDDVRTFGSPKPALVTTEKDYARLSGMKEWMAEPGVVFYLPVDVTFLPRAAEFDSWLMNRMDLKHG